VRKPLPIHIPQKFQNYDCTGCSACCRGRFGINITADDHDRIVAQGWTCQELGIPEQRLVKRQGDQYKLAHRPDGSCVFLQEDGLCRIHAKFGEPAKPFGCRMYPFRLIPAGNQIRVDMRFDCPPVASNSGRPVPAHRSDLTDLFKLVAANNVEAKAPPFFGNVTLTWPQLARVTDAFQTVLVDVSVDITRRIVACINMAALLRDPRVANLPDAEFGEYLDELVASVQEVAINDPIVRRAPHSLQHLALRHIIGIYGRIVRVIDKPKPAQLLVTSLRMLGGNGNLPPLRDELAKVTFAQTEQSMGVPSGDAALAIERYLHMHLISMGFFGRAFYGRSYLDGLNALLLTYPILCWFARAEAISSELTTLTKESAERAMLIVDHQHGSAPTLNNANVRALTNFLCDRASLRAIAIWYGS